ncbi:MAG: YlxR family protein [Candidatus Obscuribacterales bacterium]|nr:YlxR family protein [Candidatus Obscuribacterales bacterium]
MLRLTVDFKSNAVFLNTANQGTAAVSGRSAYICSSLACLESALKGTRLKYALEGRRPKQSAPKRLIAWPLESQLIHSLRSKCTEMVGNMPKYQRKEGV